MAQRIDILLFDELEELDAIGPWEIFAIWSRVCPQDGVTVRAISHDARPVECALGLVINAQAGLDDLQDTDVLVYPGGAGARKNAKNPHHLDWLRSAREQVPVLASVCSGAHAFAAAGLLAGKRATTHWALLDQLTHIDPTIIVDRDARWVDEGEIVTSAGVSAGIDMALHLVERFSGSEHAEWVRKFAAYEPSWPDSRASIGK